MRQVLLLACCWIFFPGPAAAQSFSNSNLPIVVINTDGGSPIVDDPRVLATMKIIYRGPGQRNYLTDQNNPAYLDYDGRIEIEIRGSSSQYTEKKQYGFSTLQADNVTNNNVSLLGLPGEHDWIYNSMTFDPALIRDYLSYNLARKTGNYATRTVYCELVINGVHAGLYLLQEKIKADDDRVNIVKITPTDNVAPAVTGGFITKADKTTGGDPVAWTMFSRLDADVNYIHELPDPEYATMAQTNYIKSQFQLLESNTDNNSLANGFPSVIDVPTFVDFLLVNELASNADAYQYSTYFHKDRNGKLKAGPIWDHDLTYGNDLFFWGFDRSKTNVWQFSNEDNEGSRFWYDLFNNSTFRCYASRRWNELTQPGQPFNPDELEAFIDLTVAEISEGAARDYTRWATSGNHQQHINNIKSWLNTRISWITSYLGPYADCANVSVPPLVITKIMYHPDSTAEFPDNELEFIEITNNSNQTVNLTGVYFRSTDPVYQFPVGTNLGPYTSYYIASNVLAFQSHYGSVPMGEYSRHLSNEDQNLILADGFGNIIDFVRYQDSIPWPDADGNGYYLQLINPGMDNSLATSWTASNDVILSDRNLSEEMNLRLYPNPVRDILSIQVGSKIVSLHLTDMQGRLLVNVAVNDEFYEFDMSRFHRGAYVLRIITADRTYTAKIIRE